MSWEGGGVPWERMRRGSQGGAACEARPEKHPEQRGLKAVQLRRRGLEGTRPGRQHDREGARCQGGSAA